MLRFDAGSVRLPARRTGQRGALPQRHGGAHADADAHTYACPYAHADAYPYPYPDTYAHADTHSHALCRGD